MAASIKTQNLASVAHEGVNLIGKLVNAATLWYGAQLLMGSASKAPILVMDRGHIVEMGPHEVLLQKAQGLYAHLWAMQDGVKVDNEVEVRA